MTAPELTPRITGILNRLKRVRTSGKGRWIALCPAHEDDNPSLSIADGRDGRIVMRCHAGCATDAVVAAIGMQLSDLFPPRAADAAGKPESVSSSSRKQRLERTYDYVDEQGALLYQVCRIVDDETGKKTFKQRRPDGNGNWINSLGEARPVPYRLPEILAAIVRKHPVVIVEGEKDVETLEELGFVATTNSGGALKWKDTFSEVFAGAPVILIPDNDDTGRTHMDQVGASLMAAGASSIVVVTLPELAAKGDVTDWMASHTREELVELIVAAPVWLPFDQRKENRTRYRLDELLANEEIMRPPAPVVPGFAWHARSTLFAAVEKSGKSTFLGFIAAAVSNGGWFLEERCDRGAVLIIGLEEFIGDVARRLRDFRADPLQVHVVDRFTGDPKLRVDEIRGHIESVKPRLVIIDTLMAYAGGTITEASSSAQMQPLVQKLTDLSHALEVALVLVHHSKKDGSGYRDSSAIGGAVDVICEMSTLQELDADPNVRRMKARGRVPVYGYDLRYDGATFTRVSDSVQPSLPGAVTAFVRSHPGCSLNAIRDGVGGRAADVDRTIMEMNQDGRIRNHGSSKHHKYYIAERDPHIGLHLDRD